MRYEVNAARKFTEEDVNSLVERGLIGEGKPFISIVLLCSGAFVVRIERTLMELSDEKRIKGILRQALYGMSGEMKIQFRGN